MHDGSIIFASQKTTGYDPLQPARSHPRRGGRKPRRPRRKHHHAATRRFGVAAARGEVPRPDHHRAARRRSPVAGHGLHGRQLHRNHRHPLRHPAGHLRGISLRVGRHAAVPPAQPCKRRAARQGTPRRRDARDSAPRSRRRRPRKPRSGRDGAGRRRTGRSGIAANGRVDAHGRTRNGEVRRRGALRPRSDLPLQPAAARHDRARRIRPHGRHGRRRRHRSGPRHRTGDRPERRTDAAAPPADTPFAADRQGGHRAVGADLRHSDRQGLPRRRAGRCAVAPRGAHRAQLLHGLGGDDRHGRSRRIADEHHPLTGALDAADAQNQQSRAQDARLRNDGCRDGHLHRQDGHAHPEPDARAGDHPLRASRRAAARRVGGGQLDRLPRRRRPSAGQPHRRRAARMAPARKRRLRRTARRGADSRPADLLDRTQIHGYAH